MLYIEGTNIKLTRGDTAKFSISVYATSGKEYSIKENDTLRFTIKKSVNDLSPLIQKIIHGGDDIHILPEDTKGLKIGGYVYDAELTTADGDVFTIIPPSKFVLMPEVT